MSEEIIYTTFQDMINSFEKIKWYHRLWWKFQHPFKTISDLWWTWKWYRMRIKAQRFKDMETWSFCHHFCNWALPRIKFLWKEQQEIFCFEEHNVDHPENMELIIKMLEMNQNYLDHDGEFDEELHKKGWEAFGKAFHGMWT